MNRYIRQTSLDGIGEAGQSRLRRAHIKVIGAGGLSATLLPQLVGAGIGRITIYDADTVEVHNLHRQTLFHEADVGRPKAVVAAERLAGLSTDCVIRPDPRRAGAGDIHDCDLVIDAADNFATSYGLSDACLRAGTPLISGSVLGRAGYAGGFCGGSAPGLRAVFPDLPPNAGTCATSGVMGPAVAMVGALQAQMALSVILGHTPSPLGQMVMVDLGDWRLSSFRFDAAPDPAAVPAIIDRTQIATRDRIVDLRLTDIIPPPSDGLVVLCCTTGLRAWRKARQLIADGRTDIAICGDGL